MAAATMVSRASDEHLDFVDMRRRIKAIFIGSIGNLVEWYDFYAYAAFALYFAGAFFPNSDPVVQQLNEAGAVDIDEPPLKDEERPFAQLRPSDGTISSQKSSTWSCHERASAPCHP